MRLLILTQKVDKKDPVLGFFHRWLEEFSLHCESVVVICLYEGEHNLPINVRVLSLGKENRVKNRKSDRISYIYRFFKYLWQERRGYDAVFVHMNQEYVLLGGFIWRLLGKRVALWRNHRKGNRWTKLAGLVAHKIFYTSPQAFVAGMSKAIQMSAGIDLSRFSPVNPVEGNKILAFGRVDPVKRLELFINGLAELKKKRVSFRADIVGDSSLGNSFYYQSLVDKVKALKLGRQVKFLPAVDPEDAPALYKEYKLFVNLTEPGSLDKTIFEALSSGLKVVTANPFFIGHMHDSWIVDSPQDAKTLAHVMKMALNDSHGRSYETQGKIAALVEEHRLERLIDKLMNDLIN